MGADNSKELTNAKIRQLQAEAKAEATQQLFEERQKRHESDMENLKNAQKQANDNFERQMDQMTTLMTQNAKLLENLKFQDDATQKAELERIKMEHDQKLQDQKNQLMDEMKQVKEEAAAQEKKNQQKRDQVSLSFCMLLTETKNFIS